jgi:hypothetical protein
MSQLEITTEFNNVAFVPGDTVRGKVSWRSDSPQPLESAEIRLFYYTAGKGTRDVILVDSIQFDLPGPSDQREYEFQLPEGPYSCSGKLVSIVWALELQLGGNATERLEFTLSPTGEEINLYAHDDGNLPAHSDFTIGKSK